MNQAAIEWIWTHSGACDLPYIPADVPPNEPKLIEKVVTATIKSALSRQREPESEPARLRKTAR